MEFMCPLCFRWTEIREHQVFAGNRFRCGRCGSVLLIASVRPFQVTPEQELERPQARVGSGIGQKEEQYGQDHVS